MSNQSALKFLAKTTTDQNFLNNIHQITGISGDFASAPISDDQYKAVSQWAIKDGFDFTPIELKNTFENIIQQKISEQELADAELDLVAGGFNVQKAGGAKKNKGGAQTPHIGTNPGNIAGH